LIRLYHTELFMSMSLYYPALFLYLNVYNEKVMWNIKKIWIRRI